MPIYEYRCSACGFQKEFLQRLSDAPQTDCPKCGKAALTKLVSAAGFQLKGTGWYATDFKNSGAKPVAKEKAEGPGSSAGETSAKESSTKESSAKESSKESSAKESSKESSAKESSKESSAKESSTKASSAKESSTKGSSKADSASTKTSSANS